MYTFVHNFINFLEKNDSRYTQDIENDYDILFVNSWAVPYEIIRTQKRLRPHVRVVHRIDGSARDYGRFDDADDRQACVNMLADLTVFQSDYSKYSTTKKFRVIQQDGPTIYNPVDIELFRADGPIRPLDGRIKVCNASFSTNPKKGTWRIGSLARENPDIVFVLCGCYPELPDLPNIHFLGHMDRVQMATALRSCDLFFHLAENDPCPNVVLEALASGLPLLYRDSGGTPELVGECGLPVTVDNFRQQLDIILERREELSKAARERAVRHFAPDYIFPQYLKAMLQAKRRPLPTTQDVLRMRLQGYPVIQNPIPQLVDRLRRKCSTLLRGLHRRLKS